MHKRYPVDQDGNTAQSDDRHEDEDDHADADHISRITEEQLRIKAEDRDDDGVIKPFYLGKSSARALLVQVVKAKNQSMTPASSASPASSTDKDPEMEDPTGVMGLLIQPDEYTDLTGRSLHTAFDPEAMKVGSPTYRPQDFLPQSRPEYWQMPTVSDKYLSRASVTHTPKVGEASLPTPRI